MKNIIFIIGLTFWYLACFSQDTSTITDNRDGKIYKTVRIGSQWIMAENLAYKPVKGKYWAYKNDKNNIKIHGYLYDWETAQKAAPTGWHLPSIEEWGIMYIYLGGNMEKVYSALCRGGSSGFDLTFSGMRQQNQFSALDEIGVFWSSTPTVGFYMHTQYRYYKSSYKYGGEPNSGFSIRFFKDITESEMWDEIKLIDTDKGYLEFLKLYPQGLNSDSAKLNLEKKLEIFKPGISPKEVVSLLKIDDIINETRFGGIFIGIGLLSEKEKIDNSYTGTAVFNGYSFAFENGKLIEKHIIINETGEDYFHGEYKSSLFDALPLTSNWELKLRTITVKTARPDGGGSYERTITD